MFNSELPLDATAMIYNLLSPVWMEVCMSAVAITCYMFTTGGLAHVAGRAKLHRKVTSDSTKVGRTVRESTGQRQGAGNPILGALCEGHITDALIKFGQLPPIAAEAYSARVLSAVAKEPEGAYDQILVSLAGKFDSKGFDAAVTDAHRQGDAHACRRLHQIAGLSSIPRTKRTLALIVRGLAADPANMLSFVEELTEEPRGAPLSTEFTKSLIAMCDAAANGEVDADWPRRELPMYAKAISVFGKEGRLDKAIDIFNGLRCSAPLNVIVCNCLLDACVQCDSMPIALKCFQEMKSSGLADAVSYNTLMKGHATKGEVEAARSLLKEMSALNLTASCISYHSVLHATVQQGDRHGAWQWVEEMQVAGHAPTVVTCSMLLKIVTSPRHASDLERILKLMDRAVEPSDEVLFGALAEACIRVGDLELLWERMQAFAKVRGLGKIYAPTYGSMIKAYGQARDLQRVWQLWEEMVAQQVTPTAITLGCMVEALVMNGKVEQAWKLTDEVWHNEEQRPFVNTVIYSTILKGFAMARQHDMVTALNEEMKQRGIPRNKITYNTILNSMALCGLMHRVPAVLQDMREADPRVDPDVVTYSTIIKGYCKSGDLDKSLELFQQMRTEAHLEPDELMYNSILDGCTRQNRLEDAKRILQEMLKAKIKPSNYTLSIVTRFLGRAHLDQAFATVESISTEFGFRPNIQVYTCLMQACFDNRRPEKALALHDEIVRKGVVPDERMYTALVRGCLHSGEAHRAATVVRCAYHLPCQGMEPTKGKPQGVESRWITEVLAKLGRLNSVAAKALETDLQSHAAFQGHGRASQRYAAQPPPCGRAPGWEDKPQRR